MTSCGSELQSGPLYFFDQPARRTRAVGARGSILHLNVPHAGPQLEETIQSNREVEEREGKSDEQNKETLSGETCVDGKPDTSSSAAPDRDPMDAYKRAAPHLLNELARLLSQHKWSEEGCVPHGIVNILNCSWHELTAGTSHLKLTDPRHVKSTGSLKPDQTSRQVSTRTEEDAGERNSRVVECFGFPEKKLQVRSNPRVKTRKQNSKRAHNFTTASFSISSGSCKGPGWLIQPELPSCDEPQRISLCQWVVERLQAARNPEKLQTTEQDLNKPLILRHYGDGKAKLKDRRRKVQPPTVVNGIPQIPEVKQQNPAKQKLHYKINDGSSFIYYPSGCMAVCQSHSGLPCGGFYTNVFSDGECPVTLATITAFGRGSVTHPLNAAITAVWDHDGGLMYDYVGNITKEWSWQTCCTLREKIDIQLSDVISVRLFSGVSAMLSFKCNNESVQLPLSFLPNINQSEEMPCLQTEGKITSDAAEDLLLTTKTKCPAGESKRSLTLTPEALQMVREVKGLEDPPAQFKRGGQVDRDLRRLQQRARNIVEDWLDYYRVAIGIKCPDMERMPDAPLRTRLRREVQSGALPSLNPPERADAEQVQPEDDRAELQEPHRHLSAPAQRPRESPVKLTRTPKKRAKKEPHVTVIGPLHIYGNIKVESVILPNSPESQMTTVTHSPAVVPSTPLTMCPALLRAALQGEGQRRRCCCSAALMPVVTDLEYDAFVMGQPPHSQQILVVCVTLPRQPVNTHTVRGWDAVEELYRRTNKHRTMPCTQCQMDSFRLVRYEMSTEKHSCGSENILLQQRHNAAPGMVLMYIRGKLLFVGYIFSDHSCSARDLQKQISRTRGDYRLGLSLPSDYKFSDTVFPGATDAHNSSDSTLTRRDDLTASQKKEMVNAMKNHQVPEPSLQRQRVFCIKPKTSPGFPHIPVITH